MRLRRGLLLVTVAAHSAYPVAFAIAFAFNAVGGTGASAGAIVVVPFILAVLLAIVLPLVRAAWRGARWACLVLAGFTAVEAALYFERSRPSSLQPEREADEWFAAALAVGLTVGALSALVAAFAPATSRVRVADRDGG